MQGSAVKWRSILLLSVADRGEWEMDEMGGNTKTAEEQ